MRVSPLHPRISAAFGFDTHAKRLGKVVRVHPDGLAFYDSRRGRAKQAAWLRAV